MHGWQMNEQMSASHLQLKERGRPLMCLQEEACGQAGLQEVRCGITHCLAQKETALARLVGSLWLRRAALSKVHLPHSPLACLAGPLGSPARGLREWGREVSCDTTGTDAQWAWLIVQAWNLHPLNLSIFISEMGIKMQSTHISHGLCFRHCARHIASVQLFSSHQDWISY